MTTSPEEEEREEMMGSTSPTPVVQQVDAVPAPSEVTIILRGPSDLVGWAFGALMTFAPDLEKSCAVNNGWGVHNREKGATGYMRRTKSGLSINFYRDGDAQQSSTANPDAASDMPTQ